MDELRRLRKARGMTQRELAERAGLDRVTVALIEGGKRNPSMPTLEKLADGLGVEMAALLPKDRAPLFAEPSAAAAEVDERLEVAGRVAGILAARWRALAREIPDFAPEAGPLALTLAANVAAQAGEIYRSVYRPLGRDIPALPAPERPERMEAANRQLAVLSEASALIGDAARELAGQDHEQYGAPHTQLELKTA